MRNVGRPSPAVCDARVRDGEKSLNVFLSYNVCDDIIIILSGNRVSGSCIVYAAVLYYCHTHTGDNNILFVYTFLYTYSDICGMRVCAHSNVNKVYYYVDIMWVYNVPILYMYIIWIMSRWSFSQNNSIIPR